MECPELSTEGDIHIRGVARRDGRSRKTGLEKDCSCKGRMRRGRLAWDGTGQEKGRMDLGISRDGNKEKKVG